MALYAPEPEHLEPQDTARNAPGGTRQFKGNSEHGDKTDYLYVSVRNLLCDKITQGELLPGTVLKTGSIANQLAMSRAPVRRALAMLHDLGMIRDADGQGYVVGADAPMVLSSRELNRILAPKSDDIERSPSWERIFADVHREVVACLPFGHYRILETELGNFYHVSRTVAREVLWRLTDRRLIEKNRKSHWIVGQLSARDIRDTFEMRQVLEPRALFRVSGALDQHWLATLAAAIATAISGFPACGLAAIDSIEHEMFQSMYQGLRNARMLGSIRRNQISLIVPRLFRQHFPIRDDLAALQAYGQIVENLIDGSVETACTLLETHLQEVEPVTLARLRVLSVLPPPQLAPYLFAIH